MEPQPDAAAEFGEANRRHRRRMILVVAAAALALAAGGGVLAWCLRPGPELPPIGRPYLWQVRGDGAAAPSYLFGTVHLAYEVADLPAGVRAAQERSKITVLESDLLRERPAPAAAPAHGGSSRLTDRQWGQLAAMTRVDAAELMTWESSRLLGAALNSQLRPVVAMDRGFQQRAVELGHELVFLETRSLEGVMDERVILDGLEQMIARPRALRGELLTIARRYARGADGGCGASPGAVADLQDELNATWTAGVEAQIKRGHAFIAVGCAHLDGAGSIVERLRARGYQVERVDR